MVKLFGLFALGDVPLILFTMSIPQLQAGACSHHKTWQNRNALPVRTAATFQLQLWHSSATSVEKLVLLNRKRAFSFHFSCHVTHFEVSWQTSPLPTLWTRSTYEPRDPLQLLSYLITRLKRSCWLRGIYGKLSLSVTKSRRTPCC